MKNKYIPPVLVPDENLEVKHQIEIDPENGLIIPNTAHKDNLKRSLQKIMPSLHSIRDAVKKAKRQGKHILILPGSFDLVHKGHARYVNVSVETYLRESGCQRKDLLTIMLADDDELIKQVKAFKHKDFGGDEPQMRPVEKAAERALSMAELPNIDIVGIVPSPNANKSLLPSPPHFNTKEMIKDLKDNYELLEKDRIKASGEDCEQKEILEKIQKDIKDLEKGIAAYQELVKNWDTKEIKEVPVQAWQLYVLSVISGVTSGDSEYPNRLKSQAITRFVNTADTKYLGQVLFLMKYAKIGVVLLNDAPIASTTDLIKWAISEYERKLAELMNPWEIIREYKKGVIGQHRLESYHKAIDIVEEKFKGTVI